MGKFPRKVTGYLCDECDHFSEDKDSFERVECYDLDSTDYGLIPTEDANTELRVVMAYRCPECNELFEDLTEVDRWQCVECDEIHEEREDAYGCCE